MDADQYRAALAACGGAQAEMHRRDRWRAMQHWREVYAQAFHRRTGRWKDGTFEWHQFSAGHARALNGGRAQAAYEAETPKRLLVVPEDEEFPAVTIDLPHGKNRRPDFIAVFADVYIWPPDLAWTMAFTHEQDWNLGPYFSRREWMTAADMTVSPPSIR